tara:strand:- start:393 stop:614 length:222 start_codon:yes stop_codon:yes gene_type:complete
MSEELKNLANLFNEILQRETERNEILKDSPYEEFAYSNKGVIDEAVRAFDVAYKNEVTKIVKTQIKPPPMRTS